MKAVMIGPSKQNPAGVHYGVIPGTPKPTLYKPGAEVLCATFRIAPEFKIEDLSTEDCFRYRVTCVGRHQSSGIVLAEGMGSASSSEEKYKWRRSLCQEEFDGTPENRRRVKYAKGSNGVYTLKQIRAEPADIDNTILKMACKRAQVAMTLNATAASDIFTQDIEDLPEGMRGEGEGEGAPPPVKQPQSKSEAGKEVTTEPPADDPAASESMVKHLRKRLENATLTEAEACKKFGIPSFESLKVSQVNAILKWSANPAETTA
jgi:hypothetical protein